VLSVVPSAPSGAALSFSFLDRVHAVVSAVQGQRVPDGFILIAGQEVSRPPTPFCVRQIFRSVSLEAQ
jgi:hypothetical protein